MDNWRQEVKLDFFNIKGVIDSLFYRLGIPGLTLSKRIASQLYSAQSAVLKVGDRKVGMAGKLDEEMLARFDIKQNVYAAEVYIDELLSSINLKKNFSPIPKYPLIKRDISIILNKNVPSAEIISSIKEVGASLITKVEVFDEYYGKQIPEGKRGLSFSIIYQDKTRTLTDQEVDNLHSKVKETLTQKFSAHFR